MNILIIEDEKNTAVLLKEFIEQNPAYTVSYICDSIEESVYYLRKNQEKLDLIFMDIQLADGESFEIFEQIEVTIPVVFCTAYDSFTLKAFKNNGIDYILKPIKENDIAQALTKIEQLKAKFTNNSITILKGLLSQSQPYQTSFLVRFRDKMYPVLVSDIAFAYLNNEVVSLFNFKGEKHIVSKTLDEIENVLSPQQFFRINRQMIINRKSVKEIETYFNRKVVVHLSMDIPEKAIVSRLKVSLFLTWVEKG
jgi:two-component system, LytTR family, response regulator LytT